MKGAVLTTAPFLFATKRKGPEFLPVHNHIPISVQPRWNFEVNGCKVVKKIIQARTNHCSVPAMFLFYDRPESIWKHYDCYPHN